MKYPMLNNWLVFKRADPTRYEVYDCLDEDRFLMGAHLARFARMLDGKRDPYRIDPNLSPAQVTRALDALERRGLLRHSLVLTASPGTIYRTLWLPKCRPSLRSAAAVCNTALLLLWLPLLIAGLLLFIRYLPLDHTGFITLGSIGGILLGMFLHELGHALAGLAYGAQVFEMGVMLQTCIPGAYVMLDSEGVSSRFKRVQINAAGVEANLFLAGLCLLLGCLFPFFGSALLCAAVNNIFLALINLTFVNGLDGAAILTELLGIEDLVPTAKAILKNRRLRARLRARGAAGYATLLVCAMVLVLQLTLPLLILANIVEVIGWFL